MNRELYVPYRHYVAGVLIVAVIVSLTVPTHVAKADEINVSGEEIATETEKADEPEETYKEDESSESTDTNGVTSESINDSDLASSSEESANNDSVHEMQESIAEDSEDIELDTETVVSSTTDSGTDSDGEVAIADVTINSTTSTTTPADEVNVPTVGFISSSTERSATTTTADVTSTSTQATSTPVSIESGSAVALANIINIVNSNFINSDGVVFFSNFLEAVSEVLDLRNIYDSLSQFGCSLTGCEDETTTINLSSSAAIDNYLLLQAITGGNSISNTDNGVISTGNAYAGLNLVNVANMNFVDSNYLLVTLNAFSDFNNDIIFPSTDSLLSNLAYSPDSADVTLTNYADVNNDLTVDASSGDNILSSGSGSITTGATGATSNVFNQINTSLIGGQNITILFRIHGDWVGEVFGAPDDLLWNQGPDGSIFLFDSSTNNGGGQNAGNIDISATNTASIHNHVNVVALTGQNQITGTETGLISTGDAFAGANILNLANGNVIGRNWVLAIINIFGDFNGNIAFGRPDLWVGEIVDAPEKISNGSTLKYNFTIINNGDSVATQVVFEDNYEANHLVIKNSSLPYTAANGKLSFDIGKIPPGGAVEFSYEAEVTGTSKGQELTNVVNVASRETDNNLTDNTDTATVKTYRSGGGKKMREIVREVKELALSSETIVAEGAELRVRRVFKDFPLTAQYPAMRQVVVLHNPTNSVIPAVTFEDLLKDPGGRVVQIESWNLGDVLPGEEIELGYTLAFEPAAPTGTYTLHSKISTGSGGEDIHQNGTVVFSNSMVPQDLSPFMEDFRLVAPMLPTVLTSTMVGVGRWENLPSLSYKEGMFPAFVGHSRSTDTQQFDTTGGGFSLWFAQLYAYVSSLVSKIAPAITYAWAEAKEL